MEPVFLLVLSLLLATAGAETKEAVLDTDGNPLHELRPYYVLPSIRGTGGGLRMSRVNGSCPPNVVQLSELQNGVWLFFLPEESSDVHVSEPIYIEFTGIRECPQSATWRNSGGYITTGGRLAETDPRDSRFAIVKSSSALPSYIIQFCPCRLCSIPCSTVGVVDVNGERLLTVGSEANAHEVVFVLGPWGGDQGSTNILPATMLAED